MLLVLALATLVVALVVAVFARRASRNAKDLDRRTGADHESQQRFLADNWSAVESAALQHGMTEEEVAEVRRRVFGQL